MSHASDPPKTLAHVIDEIEQMREKLLCLQRELEKMEPVEVAVSSCETRRD
jgi:hypothetical protein